MSRMGLRDFLFRGLMFEAEAAQFQQAGIRIGADQTETEEKLLDEALSPFPVGLRNQALEMARLYAVLYSFENHVRQFIRGTLSENEGANWIEQLPTKVLQHAQNRLCCTNYLKDGRPLTPDGFMALRRSPGFRVE